MCTAHGTELQHAYSHAGLGAWSHCASVLLHPDACTRHPPPSPNPGQGKLVVDSCGVTRTGGHSSKRHKLAPCPPWNCSSPWSGCTSLLNADTTVWSDACLCLCPFPTTPQAESHLAAQRAAVEEAEAAVQEALRRLREAEVGPSQSDNSREDVVTSATCGERG